MFPSARSVFDCRGLLVSCGELSISSSVGGDFGRGDSKPEAENTGEFGTRDVLSVEVCIQKIGSD